MQAPPTTFQALPQVSQELELGLLPTDRPNHEGRADAPVPEGRAMPAATPRPPGLGRAAGLGRGQVPSTQDMIGLAGEMATSLGHELQGAAQRHLWHTAAMTFTFFIGFMVPAGVAAHAGFQNLQNNPASPFKPDNVFHRTKGSALIAAATVIGLLGSLVLPTLAMPLTRQLGRRGLPALPVPGPEIVHPGLLAALIGQLGYWVHRHGSEIAAVAGTAAVGFLATNFLTTQACFNQILAVPASPFNPRGADLGDQASALCGWGLPMSVVAGLTGAALGLAGLHAAQGLAACRPRREDARRA